MEDTYDQLEELFLRGVEAVNGDKAEEAETIFKQLISSEPRMSEPRLELATLIFKRGELEEAEEQCREAVRYLERGWRWLDNLTDEQMLAHAYNLLGEILKARSLSDEVMAKGDDVIRAYWEEAGDLFDRAADLDPDNQDVMDNYFGFKNQRPPKSA